MVTENEISARCAPWDRSMAAVVLIAVMFALLSLAFTANFDPRENAATPFGQGIWAINSFVVIVMWSYSVGAVFLAALLAWQKRTFTRVVAVPGARISSSLHSIPWGVCELSIANDHQLLRAIVSQASAIRIQALLVQEPSRGL